MLRRSNAIFLLCIRDIYPQCADILRRLKRNDRVFIWRPTEYPCTIGDIIYSADLVVLPFKLNTTEPPLAIVETKAVGTRIVTSDVGGIKEVIDSLTDRLVDPNDASLLAEEILRVLDSKYLKKEIHIFGSWDETVAEMKELYEQTS